MDLKFKGKIWVGNIYQKFGAICQEVDDFVSKDTVKYVENQVQTVGGSVKRFCSDVVQDLLPSSLMEAGKCEAQAVYLKQNDTIGTCIRSMIVTEEKPVHTDINQSSAEQNQIDPLKNSPEQFINPPPADYVKEAEIDLSLGPEVDALKDKKDIVLEENDTKELVDKKLDIVVEEIDTKEELIDKKSDSVDEENDKKEEPSRPEELELICPESNDLSEGSLLSESTEEKNGVLAEVLLATLVCHTQKDKIACITFLDEVECVSDICTMVQPSEMGLSVVPGENKTAEVCLISSSSSLSMETSIMSEFSHDNVTNYGENICYNPVGTIGCVSNLSDAFLPSQPLPILCCDNKVADSRLTFSSSALSQESNDVDSSTDDGAALAGSYGNRHEYCNDYTQFEVLMSSMEIGEADECIVDTSDLETGEADDCRVDIADPSMETIELSEKAKLDESCVIVDCKLLHAISCRAQRHRSYKKILQDAFASKKRIRKEYEQLAILYGDIDIESSQQAEQNLLLPSLDSKKPSSQDLCNPEWELL